MKLKMDTFEDKLRRKTRGIVLLNAAYGFLMAFLSISLLFYAFFILVYFVPQWFGFYIPQIFLWTLVIGIPVLAGGIAGFIEQKDTFRLTLKLEEHYPQLKDRLLTMVELSENREQIEKHPFSRALARSLEADMSALLDRFGFQGAMSPKKLLLPAVFFMAFMLMGTVHAMVQPDFFLTSYQRLTQPKDSGTGFSFFKKHAAFEIKIIPGDVEISRGSNLVVRAVISGYKPRQVELFLKNEEETAWQVFPMELVKGGEYQTLLSRLNRPGVYYVKADHEESPVFQIKIFESLRFERTMWTMKFPAYMNLKDQNRQGWNGKITAPRGTRMAVELGFNQPVSPGWIKQGGEKLFKLKVKTPHSLEVEFEASQDYLLDLEVQSADGKLKLEAPQVWIQTLPDLAPYLEILEPQTHNYVFPTQEVPFEISVNDDYGLRSVSLVIQHQGKTERIEWLSPGEKRDNVTLKPVLKLEKLNLRTRDLVFAYIEVKDTFPGEDPAHTVKSELFSFLIRDYVEQYKVKLPKNEKPSVRQMFEDILADQEKIMQDTWDYISQPPKEAPLGWENAPVEKAEVKNA